MNFRSSNLNEFDSTKNLGKGKTSCSKSAETVQPNHLAQATTGWQPTHQNRGELPRCGVAMAGQQPAGNEVAQGGALEHHSRVGDPFEVSGRWETHRGSPSMAV
jgi:hypothetical protein